MKRKKIENFFGFMGFLSIFATGSEIFECPVLLDDPDAGAANPWGVSFSGDGGKLFVTHAGTHELSVICVIVGRSRPVRQAF